MANLSVFPTSNRPVAMGVNGMVASAHPLASLRVLIDGGNAFDAAVAKEVQLALGEMGVADV